MAWKNDQVSEEETALILEKAKGCIGIEGDYVEFGCYKGDTSLLLAEVLRDNAISVEKSVDKSVEKLGKSGGNGVEKGNDEKVRKRLWIYDSFEGLPEKRPEDKSVLGIAFQKGELGITKREVKERFLRAGLPVPIIKKAWFADLKDEDVPEKIAFAFLDGDFYESIRDSLRLVLPRMAESGVLIVHDYTNPALPGVAKAVNEQEGLNAATFSVVLL